MRGGWLWFLSVLVLVLSCAVPVPPTGGPEDKTPPDVTATIPAAESTGVAIDAKLTIIFSEKMTRSKVERLISSYPKIEIGKVKWDENKLKIEPAAPLHEDTTYLLILKPGFRDEHNVTNRKGFEFAFATSSSIDSGGIEGTVRFRRKPSSEVVVRLFRAPRDSAFSPEIARPDRETDTDRKGRYKFTHLPTSNSSFVIWAFKDGNGNSYFDKGKEFGAVYPDTITLTGEQPAVSDVVISIIDPTEGAELSGVIVNKTGIDTIPVSVALYSSRDDSTRAKHYSFCDAKGEFAFKNIRMGAYMLRAFIDVERDSLCGNYPCPEDSARLCVEPCVESPDSIRLSPGEKLRLEPITLEKAKGKRDED